MRVRQKKALWAGVALGAAALGIGFALGPRPLRRNVSGLPERIAAVARKHLTPEEFRDFDESVTEHVQAGRPLTKAALMTLAAIHLPPNSLDAIKAELKREGLI